MNLSLQTAALPSHAREVAREEREPESVIRWVGDEAATSCLIPDYTARVEPASKCTTEPVHARFTKLPWGGPGMPRPTIRSQGEERSESTRRGLGGRGIPGPPQGNFRQNALPRAHPLHAAQ